MTPAEAEAIDDLLRQATQATLQPSSTADAFAIVSALAALTRAVCACAESINHLRVWDTGKTLR